MVEDVLVYESMLKWDHDKIGIVIFPEEEKPQIKVATPPGFGRLKALSRLTDLFVAAVNVCFCRILSILNLNIPHNRYSFCLKGQY